MAGTQTLAIIKPDAVASGKSGRILAHLQEAGHVRALRMTRLARGRRSVRAATAGAVLRVAVCLHDVGTLRAHDPGAGRRGAASPRGDRRH
jgi:hypothetical protein